MQANSKPIPVFVVVALLLLVAAAPHGLAQDAEPAPTERQLGVAWVAGRSIDAAAISPLAEHHVGWIAQTPLGWQAASDSPEIRMAAAGQALWGETDEGLRITTELARARGVRTMLKPRVWVGRDEWRGEVYMPTDEAWEQWFASYETFILHYARFAEANDIPMLCIGTELHKTVLARPHKWSALIDAVRAVYSGELTYAANWQEEFEAVPFWEELDYIGVQGYFPLTGEKNPDLETLVDAWRPHLDALDEVQSRVGRPVLFTEIGYRSWHAAAERPWEWPEPDDEGGFDAVVQERLYEAFFRTFWHHDWIAGVYWWNWFPGHSVVGGQGDIGFTPQNKLAADVMSAWYSGGRPADGRPSQD